MDELQKKPETPPETAEQKPKKQLEFNNQRKFMYLLCGGYLIYLAVKMGSDYPQLAALGEWTGERISALCGAIGFSIIGAALIGVVIVKSVREWKNSAQAEQNNQPEQSGQKEETEHD